MRKYITHLNRETLLQEIKQYKKLDYNKCAGELYGKKEYFHELNLEQCRDFFRYRSSMISTVRANFSRKYKRDSLECQSCKHLHNNGDLDMNLVRDTQSHLLYQCPAFAKERDKYDITSSKGIIGFFKSVIKYREENGQD